MTCKTVLCCVAGIYGHMKTRAQCLVVCDWLERAFAIRIGVPSGVPSLNNDPRTGMTRAALNVEKPFRQKLLAMPGGRRAAPAIEAG